MSNFLPALMLLEPDAVTRELYRRELSCHYRVHTCQNEEEVLDRLRTEDILAIVLEPEWLDGQGWRLLGALNRLGQTSRIPVIICSVLDEKRTGYQMGVAAYCVKPVPPATLLATLRQVLATR